MKDIESPDHFEKAEDSLKKFLKMKPDEELKVEEKSEKIDVSKLNAEELLGYLSKKLEVKSSIADPMQHLEIFLDKMKPVEVKELEADYKKGLDYLDESTRVMDFAALRPVEIFQQNFIKYAQNLPEENEEKEKVEYLAQTMSLVEEMIKAGTRSGKEKILANQIEAGLNLNELHEAVTAYMGIQQKIKLSEEEEKEILKVWLLPERDPDEYSDQERKNIINFTLRKSLADAFKSIDLTVQMLAQLKYPEVFAKQMAERDQGAAA